MQSYEQAFTASIKSVFPTVMSVLNWVICIQQSSIFQIPSGLPFHFGYFFKPCPHAAAPSSPAVHTVSREPCTRVQDETPPAFLPPSLPGTH